MRRSELEGITKPIEQRCVTPKYTIHVYSWKKYGFTKIADTLAELAARAIAGHSAYLITYYKKTREERAQDFRKVTPKLQLFQTEDQDTQRIRRELTNALDELPKEKLAEALEAAKSLLKK
jgi:hypothetical protein